MRQQAIVVPSVAALAIAALLTATRPATVTGTAILETFDDALTSYLPSSATGVQDVQPTHAMRGVNIDGSLRARALHPFSLHGNPFGAPWRSKRVSGVRLDTGTFVVEDVDLSLPAPGFRWNIGRSYNARQDDGSHRNSDGYQGKNWMQDSQPEILLYEHASDDDLDVLYLVYGADRFVEFKRVDIAEGTSDTFKATNGAAGIFQFTAESGSNPDLYVYTDQKGYEFTFFGFSGFDTGSDADADDAAGQLWKIEDAASNVAYVGSTTDGDTAIDDGYLGGKITKAYDTADRRYTYTYTSGRLTAVEAETKSGGTWASPTGLETVGKVEYAYYGDESYGDPGDLQLVTITEPLSDSGVELERKKYYRYWEGTYNASSNPGHPHALKLFVDFEGVRQYDWQDSTFDEDFLTASHASLEPYSSAYFEYDASHRIDEAFFNGDCGCSGGSNGTHVFEYESNGSYSDGTGYDTDWMARTVVERPDGAYESWYHDEVGQALSRVLTDDDPDNTGPAPDRWVTYVTRNAFGMVSTVHTPASITGYTHSSASFTASSSAGLVRTYGYETTGVAKGFKKSAKWHEGTSGNKYLESQTTYTSQNLTPSGADEDVVRPFKEDSSGYTERITSGSSGEETRSRTVTVHSGALVQKQLTVTNEAVTTAENGSGTANETKSYQETDGTTSFRRSPKGYTTYREYTNGQVTKLIRDADTAHGDVTLTVPTGFASSGIELHHKTTYAYDAQGRADTTTQPDGRVVKRYYSKLADGRSVSLTYPDYDAGTPKFYGPVTYTVRNQAGKIEVQGAVALTSNETTTALAGHIDETDSDPITATDLGTIEAMTVSVFNTTGGKVTETRLYHDVPVSGAGSDGTNYDATLYGYDDLGRKWRTKEAHGTIRRTSYDAIGRSLAEYIGTNDSTFDGGESSGTDDMVKTSEVVYDSGNDDGNSYVTKSTQYVEDSATDKRETSFAVDVRGNVLLETRPETPHRFHEYDNVDRRLATGIYSSTASINTSTDDPTTEATNRLGLTQTAYDAEGRVWKTQRHEIDRSDGSDDDNLQTLHWYDGDGKRVKTEGEQLTKTAYDRLGRATNVFVLAKDNDTVYGDADDVIGDLVLEERQTFYGGDSDEVVMRTVIERFHDDKGAGETKGALDTNADGDDLLLTVSDIKGRIQITASWFDQFGRLSDQVAYGTYGGSSFDRDGLSAPARSDTALRTTHAYTTDGKRDTVEDPMGVVTKYEYDDAGRTTKVIRNYDAAVNSGSPSGTDDNVTVAYGYADGLRTTITADLPSGQTDQVTTYTYGTTKGATAGDSNIGTGHLLQELEYPDSASGSDVVTFAHNAQGQQIWKRDQAGNVFETDYDDAGREQHLRVTTIDSGFDDAVLRISRTYTDAGKPELVTQYDNATVGSGSVVNEVKYSYTDWGMLSAFEQDRNSAVGASGSVDDYEVQYGWEKATVGRNTLRKTTMTLPSGNVITYEYLSGSNLHDDEASRVTRAKDGATVLATYAYNGVASVVGTSYPEPDVMWQKYGATSGDYPDLDRFNRVTNSRWTKDLATDIDFVDFDLTYDRNGNVTVLEDHVHSGFDVEYTLDDLSRVTQAEEGTWTGSAITSTTRDQQWTLDQASNWDVAKLDLNGDGDFVDTDELNDDRTFNEANELTARDIDDDSTNDYTLSYDAVGNLTNDAENYKYEFDAFGRLRFVKRTGDSSVVSEYTHYATGLRSGYHQDSDADGDVDASDKWYHLVHDERGQLSVTFREDDPNPKEELVPQAYGLGGFTRPGSLITRHKDADTGWSSASDGTLEEHLYYCSDWQGNTAALVSDSGAIVEWTRYSGSGMPVGLPRGDSDSDGDCDSTDVAQVQAWIAAVAYDTRGDVDLDGDVDSADESLASSAVGASLGRGRLSSVGRTAGVLSRPHDTCIPELIHFEASSYSSHLAAWVTSRRDQGRQSAGNSASSIIPSQPGPGWVAPLIQEWCEDHPCSVFCGGLGETCSDGCPVVNPGCYCFPCDGDGGPGGPQGPSGSPKRKKKKKKKGGGGSLPPPPPNPCAGMPAGNVGRAVCIGPNGSMCLNNEALQGWGIDSEANGIMAACNQAHEQFHIDNHLDCTGGEGKGVWPGNEPPTVETEMQANDYEIGCLFDGLGQCGSNIDCILVISAKLQVECTLFPTNHPVCQ